MARVQGGRRRCVAPSRRVVEVMGSCGAWPGAGRSQRRRTATAILNSRFSLCGRRRQPATSPRSAGACRRDAEVTPAQPVLLELHVEAAFADAGAVRPRGSRCRRTRAAAPRGSRARTAPSRAHVPRENQQARVSMQARSPRSSISGGRSRPRCLRRGPGWRRDAWRSRARARCRERRTRAGRAARRVPRRRGPRAYDAAKCDRKCSASGRMSPRRSRSGGRSRHTTLRR